LVAAILLVGLFVAALALAATFGPLRHTSFPGHPYPPPGYYVNPFSKQPSDLVNAAEAARVRADFVQDGNIELDAFAGADPSGLDRSDTGNSLLRLRELVRQDVGAGVLRRYDNHIDSVVVGRLPDPASPSTSWCVEEAGHSTLLTVAKSSGQVVSTQSYRFEGKFWLARVADRYLITDAEVSNQPGAR
jgi:hypothetical protein